METNFVAFTKHRLTSMRELKVVSFTMKSTVLTIFMLFFSVSFSNLAVAAIHP